MAIEHLGIVVAISVISTLRRIKESGVGVAGLLWDDILVAAVVTAALCFVYRL